MTMKHSKHDMIVKNYQETKSNHLEKLATKMLENEVIGSRTYLVYCSRPNEPREVWTYLLKTLNKEVAEAKMREYQQKNACSIDNIIEVKLM